MNLIQTSNLTKLKPQNTRYSPKSVPVCGWKTSCADLEREWNGRTLVASILPLGVILGLCFFGDFSN